MLNAENIGRNIKYLRKERKISQEKMAEDLGLYQADISNIERATGGSGIDDIFKLDMIADYFNIPLVQLISCDENSFSGKNECVIDTVSPKTELPVAEDGDMFNINYSDLSMVFKFRLMLEEEKKHPHIFYEFEDSAKQINRILEKLKQASSASEEAYKVWKKDLINEKVKNIIEKEKIVVCDYAFIGIGKYKEIMPIEMVESFKCWIAGNGSAVFLGCRDAKKSEIKTYASKHIADEFLEC